LLYEGSILLDVIKSVCLKYEVSQVENYFLDAKECRCEIRLFTDESQSFVRLTLNTPHEFLSELTGEVEYIEHIYVDSDYNDLAALFSNYDEIK
jgi:hypothetical protein